MSSVDSLGNDLVVNVNGKRTRLDSSSLDAGSSGDDYDASGNQEHLLRQIEIDEIEKTVRKSSKSKPIIQLEIGSDTPINSFRSLRSTQRFGYNMYDIRKCCHGEQFSHEGFRWRYRNESDHCIWDADWKERQEEHERLKRQCMEERYGIIPILLFEMDEKEMAKERFMTLD